MRYQIAIQMSQDKLINYKYISYMFGAALIALEKVVKAASIWNEAQIHIVDSQVRRLWEQQGEQISNVASLYQTIEKISFQDSLFTQLSASQRYLRQNWRLVSKEIIEKIQIVSDLNNNFKDTLSNKMDMTQSSYIGLGLNLFGFTFSSLMFWKKVNPKQYENIKGNLKEAGKKIAEKVTSVGEKAMISSINQKGTIELRRVPIEEFRSTKIVPEADNPNSKGWPKGASAMNFIRIGFLCFMIRSFIQGKNNIYELREQLQRDHSYFKNKESLQKQVQHFVNAVKILACDLVNMASASQIIIEDLHSIYLTKAAIESYQKSHSTSRANQIKQQNFGLGDRFYSSCVVFWDNIYMNQDKRKNSHQEQLDHLLSFFKYFEKDMEGRHPNSVFLNCTAQIISIMINDSVLAHELYSKQEALFSVAREVARSFKKNRRHYTDYKNEEKIQADKHILTDCQDSYKKKLIKDVNANLSPHQKEELAGIMLNFCNEFRGTDPTGAKLYDIIIKDYKGKSTYGDLIDHMDHISESQNIPIFIDDKAKEKIEVDKMFKVAKDFALKELAKGNDKFVDVAETTQAPSNCSRYLNLVRLKIDYEQSDLTRIKLLGSNGMKFKAQGTFYEVQQEILQGTVTLAKV